MKLKFLTAILVAFVVLIGCRSTVPIMNIEDAMVADSVTKDEVRSAIIEAASKRGWIVSEVNDNELQATLNLRTHKAVVRIPYSDKAYSIVYVSSKNLDTKNNRIHASYNRWVSNLNNDVHALLQIEALSN